MLGFMMILIMGFTSRDLLRMLLFSLFLSFSLSPFPPPFLSLFGPGLVDWLWTNMWN